MSSAFLSKPMAEKITQAAEVDLSVKGTESVKSLKAEMREAKEEAIRAAREFGSFSPQAIEAQKRFAQLKDEVEDFGHRIKALNPDKFSRIQTAALGISHGFSAAQGAVALFGAESENVNKLLAQTQGAMALSQGLQGLGDAKQGLLALAGSIKGPVISAFTTLGGAARMIGGALGLGLIVSVVSLVIDNFKEIQRWVRNLIQAIPGLSAVVNALGEAYDWVVSKLQAFTDAVGLTNSAVDAQVEALEKNSEAAKRQAEIDEALGKDTYKQRKQILQDELEALQLKGAEEKEILEKQHEIRLLDAKNQKEVADKAAEEKAKQAEADKARADKAAQEWQQRAEAAKSAQKELQKELELIRLDERSRELRELELWKEEQAQILRKAGQSQATLEALFREKESDLREKWRAEDLKKAEEAEKQKNEALKKAAEERIKAADDEYQQTQANTLEFFNRKKLDLLADLESGKITRQEYGQALQDLDLSRMQKQLLDAQDYNKNATDLEIQLAEARKSQADKSAQEQIEALQREQEARRQLMGSIIEGVQALGNFLTSEEGKRAKLSKAAALAQIAIDTAQAISSLVKNSEANPANAVTGGIAGIAQFAAGLARIFVNINKARELLKAPAGPAPGGAGSAPGPGGRSSAPPQFEQLGQDIRIQRLSSGGSSGGSGGSGQQKVPVVEFADIRRVARRVQITENAGDL